ncbi:hypothetical protein F5Y03DRAFT_353462 [Xylaria venustula]|nr:hypothetical protein F5Y03DRAFT_353462 [Xylaria venustula]
MKFAIPVAFFLHVVTVVAAPTILPQDNDGQPGEPNPEAAASPPSWHLDCGSPGTTSLCSAQNSGAHCDPVTGALTITLAGTCGACRCLSNDQCTGRCG